MQTPQLATGSRWVGIILVALGIIDSAIVKSQSSTLDGHTIILAGLAMLGLHAGYVAKSAKDNSEQNAENLDRVKQRVESLSNGELKSKIVEAIQEAATDRDEIVANQSAVATALAKITQTLQELQERNGY